MLADFNYRYYHNEEDYEQVRLQFHTLKTKKIAHQLEDVTDVLLFAEQAQQAGDYVALYVPYEAAPAFMPEMQVNEVHEEDYVYAAAYVFDQPETIKNLQADIDNQPLNFQFQLSEAMMQSHIKRVQEAIVEGDTYQVNYTTRLYDQIRMPITAMYARLTRESHGNYTALINTDEVQVASISPELFFQKGTFKGEADKIISKPMKGTIPRGKDEQEDTALYEQLQDSKKDRAENVMIVDLLRNDIARISNPGSVKVYQPFHIERYDTVFQMTSMVTGTLKEQTDLNTIFRALFPCGSITGAPKIKTMSYIKALEQVPRHIYCGTIGLLLPDGRLIFNVPIRTVQYIKDKAVYGVGAGITIDSNPESEVMEFKAKTKILES